MTSQVPAITLPNETPKIGGRPAYETVTLIKRVAYANAMAAPSQQGQYGHLGVTTPPAEYAGLTAAPLPWAQPVHPGPRMSPALSAYAQIFGPFDFNRTPIAPPGIRVVAHERPKECDTWAPHAVDGWHVGPAFERHRCPMIWGLDTRPQRVCDTVSWSPTKLKMPTASSTDMIIAASKDILHALQNPSPDSPLAPLTGSQAKALKGIAATLENPGGVNTTTVTESFDTSKIVNIDKPTHTTTEPSGSAPSAHSPPTPPAHDTAGTQARRVSFQDDPPLPGSDATHDPVATYGDSTGS